MLRICAKANRHTPVQVDRQATIEPGNYSLFSCQTIKPCCRDRKLTVNFFDFSELSVSESGTLTPIGAVDIVLQLAQTANSTRTSFGCDANITSQIACKQALQSLL